MSELQAIGATARKASRELAKLNSAAKNQALHNIADALMAHQSDVVAANRKDYEAGKQVGLSEAVLDRLLLDGKRLEALAVDVRDISALPDPIGEEFDTKVLPNGVRLARRRVPIGVIGAIYESRPNVTIDISALCIKSGNAAILRGGKEAIHSNTALAELVRDAIARAGLPRDAAQLIKSTDRKLVDEMLKMKEHIDLLIPRGGAELVRRVAAEASMPAITGGIGVCHIYVDRSADVEMAAAIAYNAKVQRPSTCNALDTLLVHNEAAPKVLPEVARRWGKAGVEIRCDSAALRILQAVEGELDDGLKLTSAKPEDWGQEFLALVASVRVVGSLDEALAHIQEYGSGHTEAIVTQDYEAAMRFVDQVDAGAVLVNASTRLNDGGQFGLGAEVAISTSKLHARGPMGLRELTSYKWTALGSGQVRP
ncbi:MAG: glutamate-5-semialdehyde dehydrogenase [SAR202 cluster bacterium]|nr:glutamate-5-semialdehyde dehydrogenase [SAR202 cluster bacterium]